jgi:hypothetical protein
MTELDRVCAEGFARLDAMKDKLEAKGLYMGPRRDPKAWETRQPPMAFGGADPKPKGKGPTPLSIVNPHGPTLQPSGGSKVRIA